jgi:hypothetical protein
MMPELSSEYSFGTITVDKPGGGNVPGEGTQDKPGGGNVPGEEYLKITGNPAPYYFTTDTNPGLDWYGAGLRVNLINGDGTDGGDVTRECEFTPFIMTPGLQKITVSRGNKTAVFSIPVLPDPNPDPDLPPNPNPDLPPNLRSYFYLLRMPDKLFYRPDESEDWTGLVASEVTYDLNSIKPPVAAQYEYPDPKIKVNPLIPTSEPQSITVAKFDNPAINFDIEGVVYHVTWYVKAGGTGDGFSSNTPLPSIQDALDDIKEVYARSSGWRYSDVPATIFISGEIDSHYADFKINRDEYPPLHFKGGSGGGTILNTRFIGGNELVTHGENLTWIEDYLYGIEKRDMVWATPSETDPIIIEGNSAYYNGVTYDPDDHTWVDANFIYRIERAFVDAYNYSIYLRILSDEPDYSYSFEETFPIYDEKTGFNTMMFWEGRDIQLSPFQIAKYETTVELWYKVYQWAIADARGDGKYYFSKAYAAPTERKYLPVWDGVEFEDMIVWCNAYSEMMGKEPVYSFQDVIARNARLFYRYYGLVMDMDKNGYRLPTEAEWEYAARGGGYPSTSGPFTYTYAGSNNFEEVAVLYRFDDNDGPMEVGSKKPNSLGLFDMSGNAGEPVWGFNFIGSGFLVNPTSITGKFFDRGENRIVTKGGNYWFGEYGVSGDCEIFNINEFYTNVGFRVVSR